MGVMTGGAVSAIGGAVTQALSSASAFVANAAGAAVAAGFKAAIASATVTFADNKGNLGKTFKALGRSEYFRGVIMAMAVAGLRMVCPRLVVWI